MQAWFYTIVSLVIVSALSLTGIFFVSMSEERLKKMLLFMVSFAVGALLGDAFFELIPESFEKFGSNPGVLPASLTLAGVMGFFVLEKFVRWRHCHVPYSAAHPHPMVFTNLIGDAAHNFIDGLLVGASFQVGRGIGLATALAVVLHEIPHEIGDFGVLVQGGLKPRRALFLNFLTALVSIAGGVTALLVGGRHPEFAYYLLPITAGGFLYVAGSDLIPELHHDDCAGHSLLQFACIVAGMALMALLVALEPHS